MESTPKKDKQGEQKKSISSNGGFSNMALYKDLG